MADETIVAEQPEVKEQVQTTTISSPFSGWSETPPELKKEEPVVSSDTQQVVKETVAAKPVTATTTNEWYKEFNWETPDAAKSEIAELRKFKENPPAVKVETISEEVEEKLYDYLSVKKQFEKAEKANLENANEAANLLKSYYKFKYPDFNEGDIKEHFEEQYTKTEIPKRSDDQTDEEYAEVVEKVKQRNEAIDRKIIRDAKVAKPEFSQFKEKIVRPELPKYEPKAEEPSQESLAKAKEIRDNFLNKLESNYAKLEGFTTTVKDESVEIPVAFKVPDDAKAAIKERFKAGFNLNEFIDGRWGDEKGEPTIEKMISDVYILENLDKILSGVANNAANQRLAEYIKASKQLDLGKTPQQTFSPNNNGNGSKLTPFGKEAWSETPPMLNN